MSTSPFHDHFSAQAGDYARYRPHYPAELFAWLAAQAPGRELAWDCATGNGQAALGLAAHFAHVHATDLSQAQLDQAPAHERVHYVRAPAEASGLAAATADLVCVAQALHWFDLPAFNAEAARVLKPGGVLAVWCYGRLAVAAELDPLLDDFYSRRLGPYWPPERVHVENAYRDLPFPFPIEPVPDFAMSADWTAEELLGYLASWSATQACRRAEGRDPLSELEPALCAAWGEGRRRVSWPLSLRWGRKSG
ncbi:MAG: class I SAM-dependent methyltransferase [Gammaproteobacteria bacterium]|nr:class I SAM-dependent methyltransferase [Gammaproteobacteria bacterium]